jgi:hypothetical protein
LNDLPAANFTVFAAGMVMVSPVEGLRPVRSERAPVENDPKPISYTVSPRVTADVTASRIASMASPVLALLSPVLAATASMSSCLFIQFPFMDGRERAGAPTLTQMGIFGIGDSPV